MKVTRGYGLFFVYLFYFSLSLFGCHIATARNNTETSLDVGVVLDMGTWLGKMSMSCISMAVDDFNADRNYNTKLVLHRRDSNGGIVDAASMALDLVKNVEVKAIIGPQTSAQAEFVADLGSKAHVPILSFSATSPFLSPIKTPYFIRTTLNDSSQVKAIASIVQACKWRQVVPIYEDTEYGNGIVSYLTDALQEVGAQVPYRSVISHLATNDQIVEELYKLETMQTRVFVVHLSSNLSSHFFTKINEVGMMSEGYVWIITDGLTNKLDSINSTVIQSMQGVLGVRPYIPISNERNDFVVRWKRKFFVENPTVERTELNIFGLWAYDTVWALAKAANQVGTENFHFDKLQTTENSTDLSRFSVFNKGPKLRDAILKTKFEGLSGEFHLVHGQLELSAFQIVNLIGKGERVIGYWTQTDGLHKELNTSKKMDSNSMDQLTTIIWPGEPKLVPKGWEIPTRGKNLIIGVPKNEEFSTFVSVIEDKSTNQTYHVGYSIDVFEAALSHLPYAIPHEFVSFDVTHHTNYSYNDLVDQVYFKRFGAAVGDITIIYNRSLFVDFTMPYIDSGVTMVILAQDKRNNAWIFLKPLSWNMWLTTGASFIFTGMVVWALEYRVNDEFRGSINHQVGIMLWFIFSTLVFAHRERLVNNFSRFVLVIWVFVVLILSSSYTANLSSMLTVQQLRPEINDIYDVIKNGAKVGYQKGSFVKDLLINQLHIAENMIQEFVTYEDLAEALNNGAQKGGVGGIVDEIPYLRRLLAKNGNCDKYRIVGPIYKTDGFAFIFPSGSPLVPDISRAILNVTEGEEIKDIEKKWIEPQTTCVDRVMPSTSNSLTLDSFWGLFLFTGVVSISALLIYFSSFLYEHRHILLTHDTNFSLHQRLIALIRLFKERDSSARPDECLAASVRHKNGSSSANGFMDPISPNANGRSSERISMVGEANVPHFQTLDCQTLARRRWRMIFMAWLFRSRYRYTRIHIDVRN